MSAQKQQAKAQSRIATRQAATTISKILFFYNVENVFVLFFQLGSTLFLHCGKLCLNLGFCI